MANSRRAASDGLAPREAHKLWNGDRSKELTIAFPTEDWTRVTERVRELGLPSLSRYVEALIEMDVSANAVETIFEVAAAKFRKSVPMSRLADITGLSPEVVFRLHRELDK